MTQMPLFQATHTTEYHWKMPKQSIHDVADVLLTLLRNGQGVESPVTFRDVVKANMGLCGDSVPDKLARVFADQVDAVTEERARIKDLIEDLGEFSLTVVDSLGRPAIRGGDPDGFLIRQSLAGYADARAQLGMAAGKIKAVARRGALSGSIDEHRLDYVTQTVDHVVKSLAERSSVS